MVQQIVRIVLQAVDQASAVIKKTEQEVVGFGDKAKAAFGELKTALSSRIFQGATLVALGAALRKGWQEADTLEASMRKLGGTAKLTGTPLEFLKKIAEDAKQAFGLSTTQSNEFASAIARIAGRAGRLEETSDALRALLDVAAARGLNAGQALIAIRQAMLGIDEGTDKLFDKNPSFIYQEWAERAGTTAGKLTDTEKAQALLDELLRGGEVTRGSYLDYLQTAAGQSEQLANRTQDAAAEFGAATESLRDLMIPAATFAAEGLSGLIKVVQSVGAVVGAVFYAATEAIVGFASVVFEVIQGDFKGAFESGKRTLQNFKDLASGTAMNLEEIWKGSNQTITTDLDLHLNDRNKRTKDANEDAEKLAKDQASELVKLNDELAAKLLQIDHGLTEAQAKEMVRRTRLLTGEQANMVKTLGDGYKLLDQYNTLLAAGFDKEVRPAVKRTETQLVEFVDTSTTEFPKAKEVVGDFHEKVEGLGQPFRDAKDAAKEVATEMGGLDDAAGRVLDKAAGLADHLLRAAGGDPSALFGAIGNLAGLLGNIFGSTASSEAKQALRAHQNAIEANTQQIGDLLRFQSPGRVLAGASSAISSIFDASSGRPRGGGSISVSELVEVLAANGLSLSDLIGLASDFGIEDLIVNGQVDLGKLGRVFELLPTVEPGRVGQDFDSQRDFFRRGRNIGVFGDDDEFGFFAGLAERFGATGITDVLGQYNLSDPVGRQQARDALSQVFRDLNTTGLDPNLFGGLSGTQFSDLIEIILGILGDPTKGIGSGFTPGDLPGGVTLPDETLGGPVVLPDPIPNELLAPLDEQVALLTSIDDTLTRWIDLAAPGGATPGRLTALAGTTLNGGITINVTGAPGQSPDALADEVVDVIERELAFRLDQARANLGSAVRS